jgi:hypothetical protein
MNSNKKPLCVNPFEGMIIDEYGRAKPCPPYLPSSDINIYNYFTNEEVLELQRVHLQGKELPHQCRVCKTNEEKYGSSLRFSKTAKNKDYNVGDFDDGTILISTSNACNLKCLPCSYSSFPRIKELIEIKVLNKNQDIGLIDISQDKRGKILEIIEKYNFTTISLLGGEPFYDKVTFQFIDDLIQSGLAKNLKLYFTTNATNINASKVEKIQNNFKNFEIDCSIDGVGEVNDYLRYPSRWDQIMSGINILRNLNQPFNVRTAFSNLALLRYPDLILWCLENSIDNIYLCSVDDPEIMNPQRLPLGLSDHLHKKYRLLENLDVNSTTKMSIEAATGYANNLDETGFTESVDFFKRHDQHRGQDLLKVFTELGPYVR